MEGSGCRRLHVSMICLAEHENWHLKFHFRSTVLSTLVKICVLLTGDTSLA